MNRRRQKTDNYRNDPEIRQWLHDNPALEPWFRRYDDPKWRAWFEERRKDPEWREFWEEKRKDPEFLNNIEKAWQRLLPLEKEARYFLAADPLIKRLEELKAQEIARVEEADSIVKRLDELATIMPDPNEMESMGQRLKELAALLPDQIVPPEKYAELNAELESLGERMTQANASIPANLDDELEIWDHALTANQAKQEAIEKETRTLIRQLKKLEKQFA